MMWPDDASPKIVRFAVIGSVCMGAFVAFELIRRGMSCGRF